MSRMRTVFPLRGDIERLIDAQDNLTIRATPNAAANDVRLPPAGAPGVVNVRTTATPEDGKANDAVLALLAKALDRPRSALTIIRGATTRNKVVHIAR